MSDHLPLVSIIMPIRNESDFITRSLGAVSKQDYPHNRMEILIADGMSTDNTRQIVADAADKIDIPISIIDNPGRIVPTGFNAALEKARGDIIIRVDGHCEIASDYISACVRHLISGIADGVGGPIETISNTPVGEAIALAMRSRFGVGGSSFRTVNNRPLFVDTIAFPAYKRTTVDRAGGLDTELVRNQDDEYNYRLRSLGFRLLLTPDVRSRYYSRGSLDKLWQQYYQYGFYKVRVMQKHPQQMRPRQFAPPVMVLVIGGGGLISLFVPLFYPPWLFILAAYVATNLAASIYTASRTEWRHVLLLPWIFVTLHFSYGLGFINGLWAFRNRWDRS